MARYSDIVRDQNEVPIVGALIAVKNQDGATPVLTDDSGQVLLNPLTSDSYGAYYFNAPANFYDEEYFYGGRLVQKNYGITVGVPTLPTGYIVDSLGSSTTIAPSQRAVQAAVDGLAPRITTLEGEVETLQGTVTSGRREYATYPSAVSDAAAPALYPAVTLGQVAEIPTTDTGTHTDPVDGNAVCTGSISGTVFTAGAPSAGAYKIGYVLSGTNVTAGTTIVSFGTGTGGAGTYNVSVASTAGSTTITGRAPNSGIFRWSVVPAGWQFIAITAAASAAPYATAAAASATSAAASAAALAGVVPPLDADSLVGARAAATLPIALAMTVVGQTFTLPIGGGNVPVNVTGDYLGNTTTPGTAILEIVSGSAGTAFTVAIGRWFDAAGVQIGADVALTKAAGSISYAFSAQPANAHKLTFFLSCPASTVCRFLNYQLGAPARPTTDAWYLSLMGAGVGGNDPVPLPLVVAPDSAWDPLTGRVSVPAGGGNFYISIPSGVVDGDVVWVLFDSPLEPTAWLQAIAARYGLSGGGSGVLYVSQLLHLGGARYACSLYVQSAADGAFYGPGWTWNNTGSATYFENIRCYVGVNPPWLEKLPAIPTKIVRDEIDAARIKPLITLADDSCGIGGNQFQPSPGLSLAEFFGSGTRFQNMSTPGNTLVQSCSTVGLLPVHVTASMTILASTAAVQIPSWDYDPLTANALTNPDYDGYAYLCGVLGRLNAGSFTGNSPATLFFTPIVAPAWPVAVPSGSKLILRASRKRKNGLTLFPLSSVNGVGGFGNNAVTFTDAVFAANDPNTIAGFCGLTPNPYGTGASTLTALAGKSYIGRCYNPNIMSAATVAEAMSLFGWTWTGTENADWLAGNIGIPGSMRLAADGFHPYTDVAAYVLAKNHFFSAPVTSYLEAWA